MITIHRVLQLPRAIWKNLLASWKYQIRYPGRERNSSTVPATGKKKPHTTALVKMPT
jgi:hypothetical protein